jgi:hypothetical protein
LVDICAKVEEKVVGLMIVHEKNPSSSLLVEIKMKYDVYAYLVKYISRSKISFHTSSSCLVEDILLLEQPTSSLLEGVDDIFIADQCFGEAHILMIFTS